MASIISCCDRSLQEIYCCGQVLHAVQSQRLFPHDAKHFVDLPILAGRTPCQVLAAFRELPRDTDGSILQHALRNFVAANFGSVPDEGDVNAGSLLEDFDSCPPSGPPGSFLPGVTDARRRAWALSVHHVWPLLARATPPVTTGILTPGNDEQGKEDEDSREQGVRCQGFPGGYSTLLSLPHPFLIPGERFREMYYWDTYWVVRGLLVSRMPQTALGLVRNLLHLARTHGYVPNGARRYYLHRTQPPLLSAMVRAIFERFQDVGFLRDEVMPVLEREYDYLTSPERVVSVRDGRGRVHSLGRYHARWEQPRPESYWQDIEVARGCEAAMSRRLYREIASAAESGWDFSSRWTSHPRNDKSRDDDGGGHDGGGGPGGGGRDGGGPRHLAVAAQSGGAASQAGHDARRAAGHLVDEMGGQGGQGGESGGDSEILGGGEDGGGGKDAGGGKGLTGGERVGGGVRKEAVSLRTLRVTRTLPTDLNAFLYQMENNMAYFAEACGAPPEKVALYQRAASRRAGAIRELLWDASSYQWRDVILADAFQGDRGECDEQAPSHAAGALVDPHVYARGEWQHNREPYASNFIPLWCGLHRAMTCGEGSVPRMPPFKDDVVGAGSEERNSAAGTAPGIRRGDEGGAASTAGVLSSGDKRGGGASHASMSKERGSGGIAIVAEGNRGCTASGGGDGDASVASSEGGSGPDSSWMLRRGGGPEFASIIDARCQDRCDVNDARVCASASSDRAEAATAGVHYAVVDHADMAVVDNAGNYTVDGSSIADMERGIVGALEASGLIQPGGLSTSCWASGQQWDYPNCWPPLQHMVAEGLAGMGHASGGPALARRIARSWLDNCMAASAQGPEDSGKSEIAEESAKGVAGVVNTSLAKGGLQLIASGEEGMDRGGPGSCGQVQARARMFEKQSCEHVGQPGGGGEYETQVRVCAGAASARDQPRLVTCQRTFWSPGLVTYQRTFRSVL
eukprot:jgi/Mesvir1/11990/Mv00298-RA.2